MSDKLNQVGKTIGKTKAQAKFLLTRIGERFPQIERLRDTFSSVFPFLMEFETEVERNNLSLDLYFNPTYDFTQLCETFDATTATIQLQYSYTALSLVVKFNDIVLTREVGYFETDPILGIVTISSTYITGEATDVITICYAIDTSFCVGDCVGITDTFTRTVSNSWGTSDYGLDWTLNSTPSTYVSVNGTNGVMSIPASTFFGRQAIEQLSLSVMPNEYKHDFQFDYISPTFRTTIYTAVRGNPAIDNHELGAGVNVSNSLVTGRSAIFLSNIFGSSLAFTNIDPSFWVIGTWYSLKFAYDGVNGMAKVWKQSDPEPISWTVTSPRTASLPSESFTFLAEVQNDTSLPATVTLWDNLDIAGLNKCYDSPAPIDCGITDTFTRTTAAGDWGLSDSGDLWFIHSILGVAQTAYTDGSAGVLQLLVPDGSTGGKIFADFNNGVGIVGRDLEVYFDVTFANTPLTGNIQLRCTMSGQSATGVNENLEFTLFPPTTTTIRGFVPGVLEAAGGVSESSNQLIGPSIVWTQTIHCHAVKAYDTVNNWMRLSVNAWNGTTEPAGWMVTARTSAGRHDAVSFLGFFLFQEGGTGGGFNHMTASLDNLNVLTDGVAINNCTAVHYDNFSRFVTGGWGVTTPSGYTWVKTSGTATLSVTETGQTSTSAAAGVATLNDNFVTLRADTAPMSAGFTQTARWAFSTLPVSNQRLFVACDASNAWTIKIATGSESTFMSIGGGAVAPPQGMFLPDTFWVANAWYYWKWTLTPGILNQLSIWREDSPGTVYTVYQAVPPASVPTDLALLDFDTVHYSATVYIDYIDFDDFAVPVATPVVCPDLILPEITTFAGIFYPQNVKVWLNNTDITYTLFGVDILNPNDTTNTWRNIDISNLIKSTGRHKLKVTTSSTGKVEARLTIR